MTNAELRASKVYFGPTVKNFISLLKQEVYRNMHVASAMSTIGR